MSVIDMAVLPVDRGEGKSIKRPNAYTASLWGNATRSQTSVRGVNLSDRSINPNHVTDAKLLPLVPLLAIKTMDGYQMACSGDTLLLTETGWRRADALKEGDWILCNGDPDDRYTDEDWLKKMYITEGHSQAQIAEMCHMSERTIRAYIKKFNLGRGDAGALYGKDNPNYRELEELTRDGGYARSYAEYQKLGLIKGVCSLCGKVGKTQMHHIDHDPTNSSPDNFVELCELCHKSMHLGYSVRYVRKTRITEMWDSGNSRAVSFRTEAGNLVVEGFIVKDEL